MLRGMIGQFLKVAYALAASYAAGRWAVYYAGECRGYQAAGGEYLFILVTYCLAVKTVGILLAMVKNKKRSRRKNGGTYQQTCSLCRKTCSSCQKGPQNIIFWYDKKTEADRHLKTGNLKTEKNHWKSNPAVNLGENRETDRISYMGGNIIKWKDKEQYIRTRKKSKNDRIKSGQR